MGWGSLTFSERLEYAKLYEAGKLTQKHAEALSIPEATLERRCRDIMYYVRNLTGDDFQHDLDPDIPTPSPVPTAQSRLTDLHTFDDKTDQALWVEWLATLWREQQYVSVMHLCDIHFPFQDDRALSIAYQMVAEVQPEIIVVGSDAMDFSLLSSFGTDPDVDVGMDDELDLMEKYWKVHINTLTAISPTSALVYIMGNHERRIISHMIRQAPNLRKTVWRAFIEIVRSNDRVLWLGETDRVRIGPLLVQHGNRHNQNAAKSHLEDAAYQVSTMFGHIHKRTTWAKMGEDFPVQAVSSGALCQLKPHYVRGSAMRQKWEHGTCVADVDLRSRHVSFNNVGFYQEGNQLKARFEREKTAKNFPRPPDHPTRRKKGRSYVAFARIMRVSARENCGF